MSSLKQSKLTFTKNGYGCTPAEVLDSSSCIKVVNAKVSELRKLGYSSLLDYLSASDDHLYVGRDMSRFVSGAKGSKWQNKFKLSEYNNDIEMVLQLYENYIRTGPLFDQLYELRGKTLACWCYPAPCHASVLKRLVESDKIN